MKQIAITFLLAILSLQHGKAQAPDTTTGPSSFSIDSKILGESCKAFVYLPENYYKSKDK